MRERMKALGAVVSAVVVVVGLGGGCGGKKHEAVEAAGRVADAICKCKQVDCYLKVMEERKADVELVKKYMADDGGKLAEADKKALAAAVERAEKCGKDSSNF